MTIARELLVKLGFTFDKTNLDKFEKSIVGFKTKTTLAVGLIASAFKKAFDYANEFSEKILNASALAKFAKSTTKEVVALQNLFKKFDVPEDVFQNFFADLSLGIKEASKGVNNDFRQLVTQSEGAVRLFVNGELTTTKQAIDDIFNYIKTRSDESEKLRILSNIFKVDPVIADSILQLVNLTKNEYDSLLQKEKDSLGNLEKATEEARNFKKQVNELNVEWQKVYNTLAMGIVPILGQTLQGINDIINDFKTLGALPALKNVENVAQGLFSTEASREAMRVNRQNYEETVARIERRNIQNQNSNTINNTNSFQFTVAPSTTIEQVNSITESIKATLNSFWDEKTREVINNNPQYEL